MKMSNNPAKCEVLIKQYLHSILDINGFWGNFSHRTRQVVLSGQEIAILPAPKVANHSVQFGSSCLLTGLAI